MGKTSNISKQQWNSAHYTQIKVYVKPDTACAFKAACAAADTSMACELSAFMEEFASPSKASLPYVKLKTLGNRRKAMRLVVKLLLEIHDAEEAYVTNTPENLQNSSRFEMAEDRLERLEEALESVEDIYDS